MPLSVATPPTHLQALADEAYMRLGARWPATRFKVTVRAHPRMRPFYVRWTDGPPGNEVRAELGDLGAATCARDISDAWRHDVGLAVRDACGEYADLTLPGDGDADRDGDGWFREFPVAVEDGRVVPDDVGRMTGADVFHAVVSGQAR